MLRSVRFSLAGLLLGAVTAVGAQAAVVDEHEFFPEDIEAQFVFAESGSGPAPSLVLSQDGQSWKAERVAKEVKP